MGIEIVQGRNFSIDISGDKSLQKHIPGNIYGILMNETGVKQLGIKDPIGKWISGKGMGGDVRRWKIIGVVKDFHYKSIHHKIEPLAMGWTRPEPTAIIRISSSDILSTLKAIETEYRQVYGSKPFSYEFLDEAYDQQYKNDERLASIINYFSILAIIIACLGLFALSSFMITRRTKEIGIRKAMGASVQTVLLMLSKEYIKWIIIAAIIACPIAWYVMDKWLEGFAYHINIGMDIFLLAIAQALAIALATVAWQSIKSALTNPVKALRYE
jgi:putative ABC transport system permease protein